MTINKLVKEICRREGLKNQVNVAQVREIVGHLADLAWEEENDYYGIWNALVLSGRARWKKKNRQAAKSTK